MRFLHAADIHLDSPSAGLGRRDPALARLTATSTRDAFSNVVGAAIANHVAFLLIAGDLYDAEQKNYETGLFFANEMRRLGRPCVMIQGNHDSASQITKMLHLPPNVTVLPAQVPGQVRIGETVVHGQSFGARAEADDLALNYPAPVPGAFNIGMLHTSLDDPGEHATYAPCRVDTLVNKQYGYWALGHVHTRATVHERPWIHFPGNTQGRHVREPGSRGATLVEVGDGEVRSLTHLPTDVLRWKVLRLDISDADGMGDLAARIRFELAAARLGAEGRPLIVRIVLEGATPLHAALLSSPAAVDGECRAAAAASGDDVHIERVKLHTRPNEAGAGDLDALQQAVRATLGEPGVIAALLKDFERLRGKIPHGAQADVPQTAAELAALQDDAWSLIEHMLTGTAQPDLAA